MRKSDADLCRRIALAIGLTSETASLEGDYTPFIGWHDTEGKYWNIHFDTDADACLELVHYLFNQTWRIDAAGRQYADIGQPEKHYVILLHYDRKTSDFIRREGTGQSFQQAFAHAAANALETIGK